MRKGAKFSAKGSCVILLGLMLASPAVAQNAIDTKLSPEQVSAYANKCFDRAKWFLEMPQFNRDSSIYYSDKAIQIVRENEPVQFGILTKIYSQEITARLYPIGILDSLAERGWGYFEQVPETERNAVQEFDFLTTWAGIKLERSQPKEALVLFTKALTTIQDDNSPETEARVTMGKGVFYERYNSTEEKKIALPYLLKSLDYYRSVGVEKKSEEVIRIYRSLVSRYSYVESDTTWYYLDSIRSALRYSRNPNYHAIYYSVYGRHLITYSAIGEEDMTQAQLAEGEKNIRKALHIIEQYKLYHLAVYPYSLGLIADLFHVNKQYDSAIAYYMRSRNGYLRNQEMRSAMTMISMIKNSYRAKGDLANALKYSELYTDEGIKFERESSQKSVREGELALSVLRSDQQLAQTKQRQIIFIIALVAGFVLLILLYRNYRLKQKSAQKLELLVAELSGKNSLLDKRNEEIELLLKEVHHRVKNNLEMVSGLLALQAAKIESPSAQAVMQSSQNRVISMGIVHQKLYQKGNLAAIEMKDYFQNLADNILDAFNETHRIKIGCEMPPIELDIDTAVPVGLITNELLTNALKYAFTEKDNGEIKISLQRTVHENELELCVADNGIGKPTNGTAKGTGFGTELINLLVRQLEGRLSVENGHGTQVRISFPYMHH
ncbi:MAG TPA: sensor histidine kinase [Cyclobacteriaceae bacterium]|nr:histidine kinase [Cytophagales bacterium]HNP76485.1 sensor histidine kinase [Cyclobacteriaceae bacterium]